MKFTHTVFTLLGILFLTVSCSSDDDNGQDTTPPVVSIIEPHDHDAFGTGDIMSIEINFSDNQALGSYKIEIHHDDGHTHDVESSQGEWSYIEEGTLSGTDDTVLSEVEIPDFINEMPIEEGDYHFGVYALDAAGNETVVWQVIVIGEHGDEHGVL